VTRPTWNTGSPGRLQAARRPLPPNHPTALDPHIPRIVLTPGEPAGIGPDLAAMIAHRAWPADLVLAADPGLLQARAAQIGTPVTIRRFESDMPRVPHEPGHLHVLPVALGEPARCGRPSTANAQYVLESLGRAVAGCLGGQFDALVTGPVHKGIINDAGIPFSGHTEYLAALSDVPRVVMMLAAPGLRVALATTHLPLARVSQAITQDGLLAVLRILIRGLRTRFGIERPRITVCGLNPHAGEGGHLGHEERDIIVPALAAVGDEDAVLDGPVPADTAFTPASLEQTHAVLAMYHDQGLPVLKHLGFGQAVNITLGLPFVRTSVDHGTALELACTGRANPGSLEAAITTAIEMVRT